MWDRESNIVFVPETLVGAVIGKGGAHARSITENSGAKIHIETRTEKETRVAEDEDEVCARHPLLLLSVRYDDCSFGA